MKFTLMGYTVVDATDNESHGASPKRPDKSRLLILGA